MRKTLVILVVGLALVSAGCGGFGGDGESDREPYGLDEEYESRLLAGLTEDGVTDRTELANEHYDALEGESYHYHVRYTVRNATGSNVSVQQWDQWVTADAEEVHMEHDDYVDHNSTETRSLHAWDNRGATYIREEDASGNVTYDLGSPHRWSDPGVPGSLLDIYGATDSVSVERANGTERYHLEGSGDLSDLENASFELVLAETGFVESFWIEGTQVRYGERITVERVGGYELIGDPELEEPEWIDEAIETWTEEMQ